jgi:hypothetical protein
MLFVKWPRAITFVLLCICINTPAFAQSLKAQQTTLAGYEKQLDALNTQKQELTSTLSANQSDLGPLNAQDSPEKAKLDAAKMHMDKAMVSYASDPTSENKAKKSNAAFKHALAERKFKKANKQLFELQQKEKALSKRLAATGQQISTVSAKIDRQRKSIERLRTQQSTAANLQREQQQQQKQREAENEIQRLRAELDQQKQMQAQKDAEAKLVALGKASAPQAVAPKIAVPSAKIATPKAPPPTTKVAATTTVPPKAQTAAVPAKPPVKAKLKPQLNPQLKPAAKGKGAMVLASKEQVMAEEKRLADLQTKPGKKRSRYNKILNIKTVRANGSISRPKANTLRALGNNQYRASVKLKKGSYILVVGFNNWRQTIPAKPGGTEYIFIYDASESKKPRLVYFDKALSSQ